MKIVTWNCHMKFRQKFQLLDDTYNADFYIIQECEYPEAINVRGDKKTREEYATYKEWAGKYHWTGKSETKGLGIFAKNGNTIERLDWPHANARYFLPCKTNLGFTILGVWCMDAKKDYKYIGQFWHYFQENKKRLSNAFLCGDFNSNSNYYSWNKAIHHNEVVRELEMMGLVSYYHELMNEETGQETIPTLYLNTQLDKPFHVDYIFGPKEFAPGSTISVGAPDKWDSDHMPIVWVND